MTQATPNQNTGNRPRCIIVGCGGHGRVVLDILHNEGKQDVVGFVDSNRELIGRRVDGVRVIGHPDDLPEIRSEYDVESAVVAIGNNGVRRSFAHRLDALGYALVNAIHPSANIALNASVGQNAVIAAGALVCAHCQIGDSVILNTGCIVDHESFIGTATHVCPGARLAGRVTVEAGAFIGIGATVCQSLRIGCEAIVGAGAVVTRDVEPMTTVVGVPARAIRQAHSHFEQRDWLMPEQMKAAVPVGEFLDPPVATTVND